MPDVDEINSNLGALESQLEELSRLKDLVESLSEREEAANAAVRAAERASDSSKKVIERFENATARIEGTEVVGRFEEIEDAIRRFEEAGRNLESQIEALPDTVRKPLVEYHEKIEETLSEDLSDFRNRLEETENSFGVLQNALEQRFDRHHSDITDALASAQEDWEEHRDEMTEKIGAISNETESISDLLQEAQLKRRLGTLQDTASNANQAAQNGLSRIDAVERSLSDTLDEHRRRQNRQNEELEEEVVDLRRRFSDFESFTKRMLWAVLAVGILTLGVAGWIAYVIILAS